MKFLCPSCKAKYQISDDKVAGRSVRMKCRKCGHMISIGKAVTEGSASRRLESTAPPAPTPEAPPASPAAPTASPAAPGAKSAGPIRMAAPKPSPLKAPASPAAPRVSAPAPTKAPFGRATAPTRPGAVAPVRPAAAPARPVAPARPAAPAPRPIGPPRATAPARPTPQVKAVPTPAARAATSPLAEPLAEPKPDSVAPAEATYDADEDEQTQIASGVSALSSAFSQAVRAPDSVIPGPADEWYVGINGVPVGPIRLSELRSKAATGAIGLESLVWREGFEEWQPLRTFPELIAIVEEGMSSARASLTPMSPPTSQPAPTAAIGASPFGAPTAPVGVLSDPFALPAPPASAQPPPSVEKAPFPELAVIPPRRSTGAAAWIAVVVALLFGLTIGFVLFSREKVEPVVKVIEVPAKGAEPAAKPSAQAAAGNETEAVDVAAEPGKPRVGGPLVAPKANGKEPEKTGSMSGLKGLAADPGAGPSGGSPSSETGSGAGGQLDSGQVQKVVSRYTASVKRSCWQPALDTRTADAPTSARVGVTITVAPSGSVSGVTTTGDPRGYRGLASCIQSRVRGWQFPASSGSTTVNVPFFFAAQ